MAHSSSNSNYKVVPEAADALNKFKYEVASEVCVKKLFIKIKSTSVATSYLKNYIPHYLVFLFLLLTVLHCSILFSFIWLISVNSLNLKYIVIILSSDIVTLSISLLSNSFVGFFNETNSLATFSISSLLLLSFFFFCISIVGISFLCFLVWWFVIL